MFTVLLVDDEISVLNILTETVPWQQFGVDPLLTAHDGVQALEIMRQQEVHLLVTDIRMPDMDGMELLRQVRTLYPDTHCILLTAYSEFTYAQEAIRLGVENYLLKPFQGAEMIETIETALDNIYTMQKNSTQLFCNNILLRWANGSISDEDLSERASLLGINIYLKRYCVVCVRKLQTAHSLSAYTEKCIQLLSSFCEVYPFQDSNKMRVFIIGASELEPEIVAEHFQNAACLLQLQDALYISIGPIVNYCNLLPQSYMGASTQMEQMELSEAVGHCSICQETSRNDDLLTASIRELFQRENTDALHQDFILIADQISSEDIDLHDKLSRLGKSLLFLFRQDFPGQPGVQEQIYHRTYLVPDSFKEDDLPRFTVELLEYSYLLYRFYYEQFSPIVRHLIAFTHEHYAENLSLKEFCVKTKMNTSYLGFLFKKETGMFYNNYLLQYRICCAIHLLLKTELQVNDIALQAGFSSPSYFISCFRKQTGLSPVKYRALMGVTL